MNGEFEQPGWKVVLKVTLTGAAFLAFAWFLGGRPNQNSTRNFLTEPTHASHP